MKLGFGSYLIGYIKGEIEVRFGHAEENIIIDFDNDIVITVVFTDAKNLHIFAATNRTSIQKDLNAGNALNPFLDLPSGLREEFERIRLAYVDYLTEGHEGNKKEILAKMNQSAGASNTTVVRRV